MSVTHIIVRGRLNPDGTIELDNAPNLPAGPVEVVLRALPIGEKSGEDWWQYLQRVRGEAEAAGEAFRSQREIDRDREAFRSGDDRFDQSGRGRRGRLRRVSHK